jgi:hypothetical protein
MQLRQIAAPLPTARRTGTLHSARTPSALQWTFCAFLDADR